MFVQEMPMAAGFEGFPVIPSVEPEASLIVKAGCGSKRKAEEDGGEVTVKAMAAAAEEEAPVTLKAKAAAEEESAFTTVKAKAEEEAPVTVKAKEAEEEAAGEVIKVVLTEPTWEEKEYSYVDSDEEVDSDDEDAETFLARIRSEFNAHAAKVRADNPWLKWGHYDTDGHVRL